MMTKDEIAGLPLRERKKEMIRQAIVKNAERLFEERGYDQVTVVEIADAANVSVKTLFTYYRSKEDLLFQDTSLLSTILKALKEKSKKDSPITAVVDALIKLIRENGHATVSLGAFQQGYGNSEALKSRMLKLWEEYEEAIAKEIASQANLDRPTADIRFLSAQLVSLIRAFTWSELYDLALQNEADSVNTVINWLTNAAKKIG